MKPTEIAEALFGAFESGNAAKVRELCSPELRAIQNLGPASGLEQLIQFTAGVLAAVESFRYSEAIRTETKEGFVEEHRVCATLRDGTQVQIPACVIARIEDGRIVELREYLDAAAARPLIRALSEARS